MYIETTPNYETDVYANLIVQYKSVLIERSKIIDELDKMKILTDNKIYLRNTSTTIFKDNEAKKYKYKIPYQKSQGKYVKLTQDEYKKKRYVWEKGCELLSYLEELDYIIKKIETTISKNILVPHNQPSLQQIKKDTIQQTLQMAELTKTHSMDNYQSPYQKHVCHTNGASFASRAELLIYEEAIRCGLQVLYEYKFLDTNKHIYLRPDFYGIRGNLPYVIEFFGIMDNIEYRENTLKKIQNYTECGFSFNKNLIAFSTKTQIFMNMKTVHTILKDFSVYGITPDAVVSLDSIAS